MGKERGEEREAYEYFDVMSVEDDEWEACVSVVHNFYYIVLSRSGGTG